MRNAQIRNLPQVTEEMGTRETMLRRHYHTGPAPCFTRDISPTHAAYTQRIGIPYLIPESEGGAFEHCA